MKEYTAGTYLFEVTIAEDFGSKREITFETHDEKTTEKVSKLLHYLKAANLITSKLPEENCIFLRNLNGTLNNCYIHDCSVFYFEGDVKNVTNKLI